MGYSGSRERVSSRVRGVAMAKDSWNLPPGCTSDMIPGNSDEDIAFEIFLDSTLKELAEYFIEEEYGVVKADAIQNIMDDPENVFRGKFWKFVLKNWNNRDW